MACTRERNTCTVFWLGDLGERKHLEDLGEDGTITANFVKIISLPVTRDERKFRTNVRQFGI